MLKYVKKANPEDLKDLISPYLVNEYDVRELVIEDTNLSGIDFIEKFVTANSKFCTTLKLARIELPPIQNRFT